ncbi:MAG: pirin family protein [Bacteroidota bacterium]
MIRQSKAKIFLAEHRGLNETKHFRSLYTFNFGNYFNEHKAAFNNIYAINDEMPEAGQSINALVQECSYIVLLPIVGAVNYKDSNGNEKLIAAGQVEIMHVDNGVSLEITNPFKEHCVNFLQAWIKAGASPVPGTSSFADTYAINESIDNFIRISPAHLNNDALPFIASIGKFNGRTETYYLLQHKNSSLFIFVLEGAFEVQGRLLHARDGLALWETTNVEIEALSNDAIVLLIETPGNKKHLH